MHVRDLVFMEKKKKIVSHFTGLKKKKDQSLWYVEQNDHLVMRIIVELVALVSQISLIFTGDCGRVFLGHNTVRVRAGLEMKGKEEQNVN